MLCYFGYCADVWLWLGLLLILAGGLALFYLFRQCCGGQCCAPS